MSSAIDSRRYRKLVRFLTGVFLHFLWWDFLLNRSVLRRLRSDPLQRWTRITRRFRVLAVEMGGVLIKLGQFLSTRVDLLPREITEVLGGLQDEVPAADFGAVAAQIEEDFGRGPSEVFRRFEPEPIGAASLAQVYQAELDDGREVVVKVLRPGIDVLVETDLKAIGLAIRGLGIFKFVRRRVDLDRLAEEFVTTTRRELDMVEEGRNAERFAHDFAADDAVLIPKIYWAESAARTLTLENVGFLKISEPEALKAAGIDLTKVAAKLFEVFLQQIFVHNFVHADPHPGNLFVKPLPADSDRQSPAGSRPFQVAFVDFGMVAAIPDRLRNALREYVIALGTRDAYRIVQAYQQAGLLLPGADLKRLEEAHEAIFERFWGVRMGDLRDKALKEMGSLLSEYRDLVFDYPFQAQVELLFVQRAIEILIGVVTRLDPDFDLWAATRPFAMRMARESQSLPLDGWLPELTAQARSALGLPAPPRTGVDRCRTRQPGGARWPGAGYAQGPDTPRGRADASDLGRRGGRFPDLRHAPLHRRRQDRGSRRHGARRLSAAGGAGAPHGFISSSRPSARRSGARNRPGRGAVRPRFQAGSPSNRVHSKAVDPHGTTRDMRHTPGIGLAAGQATACRRT